MIKKGSFSLLNSKGCRSTMIRFYYHVFNRTAYIMFFFYVFGAIPRICLFCSPCNFGSGGFTSRERKELRDYGGSSHTTFSITAKYRKYQSVIIVSRSYDQSNMISSSSAVLGKLFTKLLLILDGNLV